MKFLTNILKHKQEQLTTDEIEEIDLIADVKNWYSDRYETALVQRNILFLMLLISTAIIFLGVFMLGKVASSKSIEPFIVQIEEKSGITNVVNPLRREDLTTNEALNTYFTVKYIQARETYDPANYEHNYKEVVRVLSAPAVYREFLTYLNSPSSPLATRVMAQATSLNIRSLQFLETNMVQVRFTIDDTLNKRKIYKIATIRFDYAQMELNLNERLINPLGFRITNYRSDNEIL